MLFACSFTGSPNAPKAPTPPRKLLNQGSLAEVPRLLCQVLPSLFPHFSCLFEDPQFLLGSAQVSPILAQLGSQCGAWAGAPDRDAAARHTPGAFVRAPRSRPLSERGTSWEGVDWLGLGVTERQPGNELASCAGAVLCGKVGALLPGWLTSSPGPRPRAGGRDPGMCGAGSPCPPRTANAPQHTASPQPQPGRNRNANPPAIVCSRLSFAPQPQVSALPLFLLQCSLVP